MLAKMRNIGEACTAANRIYVQRGIAEAFTARLTERMAALKVGNGLDEGVSLGPLVNAETRDKVAAFVEDAVGKGARLLLGGEVPEGKGFFYPATVLADVPDDADCLRDEIFGPVAAIQTFADEAEVIAKANATEYGLVAYVFTGDIGRGLRVCERLEFGMVGLNRGHRLGPRGAVRRHEAVGARPRGRARGHPRVPGEPVHLGRLVGGSALGGPGERGLPRGATRPFTLTGGRHRRRATSMPSLAEGRRAPCGSAVRRRSRRGSTGSG